MMESAAVAMQTEPTAYGQVWAESFSQALAQIAATPVPCVLFTEAPAEVSAAAENDLWILSTCAGGLRGEMSLRLSAAAVLRVAQLFMSEPAAPDTELTPHHREALIEFLRQVAGIVSSAIKSRWGEVQLRMETAPGPASWSASSSFWIKAGDENLPPLCIELHLSAALVAALRAEAADGGPATSAVAPAAPTQENSPQLGMLMDVELAMTLRFGSRHLLLREVLDLNPGAVIELDRQVQDPVDVLLDGRLVARGEVVVLEGNYGLRVTEIVEAGVH
jgi:flagellar motor switch protein FliN/FliY